jgi:hypothetical protein
MRKICPIMVQNELTNNFSLPEDKVNIERDAF